jgi:uncharacterized protein YyaL (SSP411 family)
MKKIFTLFIVSLSLQGAPMKYTNDLIHEDSPYLQQHAHNPVHWMPWGKKAFEKAAKENKMIFLSIGYSTCHWCHVMEHESFENEKLAKYLNEHFVAIKVDREEMPQIDKYYQTVYQLMNNRGGGWPLTIILTPERKPFFSGTYIPLEPKYGSAGLWDVLKQIVDLYKKDPEKLEQIGGNVVSAMKKIESKPHKQSVEITKSKKLADQFVREVSGRFDERNGGIGQAPKFPHASTITVLLQIHRLYGNKKALSIATSILDHMAYGGIYDQIEGGFYRYSTDERWMIPHFEKMLYTNAELLEAYGLAFQITGNTLYKKIIEHTAANFNTRYRYKKLFYSASDADSLDPHSGHKEEGYYFVYTHQEALAALKKAGIQKPEDILEYLGISFEGNFEQGRSNPHISKGLKVDKEQLQKALEALKELRAQKPYPFVDHKLLSAWNGLMIHGLYVASTADATLADEARDTMDALLGHLYIDGKLYHQVLPGKTPKVPALMEDYSFVIMALLDTYEHTFDTKYLDLASRLTKEAKTRFAQGDIWRDGDGDFASTASIDGNAYRSALAVMAEDMLRVEILSDDDKYGAWAQQILQQGSSTIAKYPFSAPYATWAYMEQQNGYIVLKAKPDMIKALKTAVEQNISYPLIAFRTHDDKMILACRKDRCFAYDEDMDKLVEKVAESLK